MGIEIAIAAVGLGVAAAGAAISYQGQKKAQAAQDAALAQQQDLENKRQIQMNLDANRKKQEQIRQQIAARSYALATATAQGASQGSALPGVYGGVSGRTNVNELGINQNQQLGNDMFAINRGILGSYRDAASAGSYASLGAGLSSFGGALLTNVGTISKVGQYATSFFNFGSNSAPAKTGEA